MKKIETYEKKLREVRKMSEELLLEAIKKTKNNNNINTEVYDGESGTIVEIITVDIEKNNEIILKTKYKEISTDFLYIGDLDAIRENLEDGE